MAKKYLVTVAQEIHTCILVEADDYNAAVDAAYDLIDDGQVEFTQDSIAEADGEINIVYMEEVA